MQARWGSKRRERAFFASIPFLIILGSSQSFAQPDVIVLTLTSRPGENLLEWRNPPGFDAARIIGRTDGFPSSAQDTGGAFVVDVVGPAGGHASVVHSGLTAGTTYFYGAFASDGAGSHSAGKTVAGSSLAASGPIHWRFTPAEAAVSLTPPGIGTSVLFPNNNGIVYPVQRGPSGGAWPGGAFPTQLGTPVQHRPPVIALAGMTPADRFTLVSGQDGVVRAVDTDSGGVVWSSADLGTLQAGPGAWFVEFGGASDSVLVGTRNHSADNLFVGLQAGDGQVDWSFDDAIGTKLGVINGAPTIDYSRSMLYFACHERTPGADTVYALDLSTGGKVWSVALGNVSGSPILRGGVIYVGADDGRIFALDADDGDLRLNFPFDTGDGVTKGFVFPDFAADWLYFSTRTTVWALRDVGPVLNQRWRDTGIPDPSIVTYPPGGRYLWVGSSNGRLYQIDVTTGNPAQPPQSTSIVLGDGSAGVGAPSVDILHGIIYVGIEDGSLYAVRVPF